MSDEPRKISKSQGQTPTEASLARFCDNTFLKLWSDANPFNSDGKELCDLIAVFENHVFLFFDRESKTFDTSSQDISVIWERWKKKQSTGKSLLQTARPDTFSGAGMTSTLTKNAPCVSQSNSLRVT